ncbi:MAG TPA: biotin carboxylase N-terminal domain-containing protein [Planctomycetota bacterium]|jgi:acetyl/propionyl-CoA carboxylase alpha subunit
MRSLFIANRGEIALRVARTARRMGLQVLGAFSSVDGGLPHLRLCHRATELTGEPAKVYLDIGKIIDAARKLGADAVHPGYGFLAEKAEFAAAVNDAGMTFVGPTPKQIETLGDKVAAKKAAAAAGVPLVPGHAEALEDLAQARQVAQKVGYPVLIKAAGGGGGRGMRMVKAAAQFDDAFARARSEAQAAFGDPRVFIERYIRRARHVEIQVLGDGKGRAISLGERDCSIQRRHQKLLEESPAPGLVASVAAKMGALAAGLAASVNYRGAGTVEFIVPFGTQEFFFIEVNTRLQVEHPVTEMCTGIDLVEAQLLVAQRGALPERLKTLMSGQSRLASLRRGHAIEARIIAEDPDNDFRPSCGKLDCVLLPNGPGVRVDSWAEAGLSVSPFYDSLLGKVIAWGQTRAEAIARLELALHETLIGPLHNTAPFLARLLATKALRSGQYDTGTLARLQENGNGFGLDGIPAQAAVAAAAECLARSRRVAVMPRWLVGRALSPWQLSVSPEDR